MSVDIFALMKKEEEKKTLVKSYEILKFERNPLVPCKGVLARFDARISDVIPIIFIRHLGTSSYIPRENILTLKLHQRLITLYPDGRVALNAAWEERAARKVLEDVKELINEAYGELLREGMPTEEEVLRALKLSWSDVYELLPKTNCGECGYQTCSSFAAAVFRGEARLDTCKPLVARREESERRLAEAFSSRILRALGWR